MNILAGNYMFKVNNRNTRTKSEICSNLTIEIPKRRHISLLVFLLLNLSRLMPTGVNIVSSFFSMLGRQNRMLYPRTLEND